MSLSIERSRKTERTAQMTAYFTVRAQVIDPTVKNDFDRWYRDEHLPDALKRLVAQFDRAWGNKVTRSRDFVEVIQAIGA